MNLSDQLIKEAFANEWHTCFYQPKVKTDSSDGSDNTDVIGVEALFRLDIPEHGIFAPGTFIDRAFALGYEETIFFNVLEQALTEIRTVSPSLNLAVNISKQVLANPDNVARVREMLWNSSFPAKQLTFELSENDELCSSLASQMESYKALGVKFSVDDFGVGYSDIDKIQKLSIDEVKFDRSLINKPVSEASQLIETVIEYCRNRGISTVAEGVEDHTTRNRVQQLGFDSYQGFLYSKPVALPDLMLLM